MPHPNPPRRALLIAFGSWLLAPRASHAEARSLMLANVYRPELPVADFYKQLAWEVDQGYVKDNQTTLEPGHAAG